MKEQIGSEGVEDLSKNVDSLDDAVELVKKIDKMITNKKNNILMLAYHQRITFRKFKENNRFTSAVSEFNIIKTTTDFKIEIVKFINRYPKMRTSCISLFYLKNNVRIIKEVCQDAGEFQ